MGNENIKIGIVTFAHPPVYGTTKEREEDALQEFNNLYGVLEDHGYELVNPLDKLREGKERSSEWTYLKRQMIPSAEELPQQFMEAILFNHATTLAIEKLENGKSTITLFGEPHIPNAGISTITARKMSSFAPDGFHCGKYGRKKPIQGKPYLV